MAEVSEHLHGLADSLQESLRDETLGFADSRKIHDEISLTYMRALNADHFFLEATRNSSRWVEHLLDLDPTIQSEVDEFHKSIDGAKAIRDMRVHADDYVVPGRRGRRKDFVSQIVENEVPVMAADATSSVRRGGDVIYGGRVSRDAVRAASHKLRSFLSDKLQQYQREDSLD